MATAPRTTTKKVKKGMDTSKKKVIASKKKRFNLSKKQWGVVATIAIVVLGVGTYFGVQYYQGVLTDAASCKNQTFRKGASSACIRYAKKIMAADGIKNDGDSVLGTQSVAAVKKFQKKHSDIAGKADGIIGTNTWKALCAVGKSKSPAAAKSAGCSTSTSSVKYYTYTFKAFPSKPVLKEVKSGYTRSEINRTRFDENLAIYNANMTYLTTRVRYLVETATATDNRVTNAYNKLKTACTKNGGRMATADFGKTVNGKTILARQRAGAVYGGAGTYNICAYRK